MTEIAVSHLSKSFGANVILDDVSFNVNKGERVGIVGGNGAGKSTLLKILAGRDDEAGGKVFVASGKRPGYLRQETGTETADVASSVSASARGVTILEVMRRAHDEAAASGATVYESEIRGILRSMAFPDSVHDSPIGRLSGGEKTRLAFAELLLKKPDILLLDEPTNHLDIGTLNWLEQKLKAWNGTILLVSHDRYFLDQTVNRIFEIEHRRLTAYDGNYSVFAEKKRALREARERAFQNRRAEIGRQEEMIRRFKERGTEKLAKRAASREKRLARLPSLERPVAEAAQLRLRPAEERKSGEDVIAVEGVRKSFEANGVNRELFRDVALEVKRGERICMVGANGVGKTTLLKILLGRLQPDGGRIRKGHNVNFGYYDQEQQSLAGNRTVLEEMTSAYRSYSEGEMRNILAGFLFTGDMVFQEVASLSGGERAKLSLLKTLLSGANTLLLDEPTNHMDIASREAIEDALLSFTGTLLIISHDRYFLGKVPTRIVELTGGGLVNYPGNYDYFMEKKSRSGSGRQYLKGLLRSDGSAGADPGGSGDGSGGDGNNAGSGKHVQSAGIGAKNVENRAPAGERMGKARETNAATVAEPPAANAATVAEPPAANAAEERLRKKREETERRRIEKKRAALEAEIGRLETAFAAAQADIGKEGICADPGKLARKAKELDELTRALDAAYAQWCEL